MTTVTPEANVVSDSSSTESNTSWIQWYTSSRGNELFCEVDEEFINDQFNLYGLSSIVPGYTGALDIILDNEEEEEEGYEEEEDEVEEEDDGTGRIVRHSKKSAQEHEMLMRNAELLYGLIHARFIQTSRGMTLMLEKYRQGIFGKCPRYLCNGQAVLPVGLSDIPRQQPVRLYCPRCEDVYIPKVQKHANIDGAYFGTSFPHMLLLQYPELVPPKPAAKYVPKIFGFKIRHPPTGSPSVPAVQQHPVQQPQTQQTSNQQPQQPPPAQQQQQSQSSQQVQPTTTPNQPVTAQPATSPAQPQTPPGQPQPQPQAVPSQPRVDGATKTKN
ncbi:casein kinase II subunit beta [Pelomyxa schiedti]|nr:casein kinase II subunit beta [Pelomyxa schiedti]